MIRRLCAVLLLVGAGCSALFPSLGDLTNAGDAGDAGLATDATDAGPTTDASDAAIADGALPTSDGATGYCAAFGAAHAFCADWDETNATPLTAWNGSWASTKGSPSITMTSRSPPNAVATTLFDDGGTGELSSTVVKVFAPAPTSMHCAYDMMVVQIGTGGPVGVVDFFFDSIATDTVEPSIDTSNTFTINGQFVVDYVAGVWTHFDWTVTRSGTTAALDLSVNGSLVYGSSSAIQNVPAQPATGGISIGFDSEGSRGWTTAYDNVICDVQ